MTATEITIADLADCEFIFTCEFGGDGVEYFDYDLNMSVNDERYHYSVQSNEIEHLRMNCKRILEATEGLINERY